jgi:4-amino-4-deoxy-L-arabinose transferase-like glycosyltransferase
MVDRNGAAGTPAVSGRIGKLANVLERGLWPIFAFIGVYCTVSLLVRLALPNALTLDEAEQSLFSQYWLLGYGPQPPFFNWVQNAVVSVLGVSLFALALPKFTMLFLAYVFFGLAARELDRRPGFVAVATLSLLTLPQVSYMPQQDLTHTVAVLMATSLFLYGLFRTLKRPDWQSYLILGLAAGIGTISKYNFVMLPAATFIAVVADRQWRNRLLDPRFVLSAAVGLFVVLPHTLWLLGNLDLASAGTIGKMVEANAPQGVTRIIRALGSLALACIAFGALTVIILGLAFKHSFKQCLSTGTPETRLLGRIMLISLLGVVIVIIVAGTTKITERWLDPYLMVLPLYLLLKLDHVGADVEQSLGRLMPVFLVIMVITLLPLPGKTVTGGLTGSYTRINYPFAAVADALEAEGEPAIIVAAGMHLAGNMRMQFPDVPVINSEQAIAGFPPPEAMKAPVLAIWVQDVSDHADHVPIDLSQVNPLGLVQSSPKSLALPFSYGDGKTELKLGYVWLGAR